MKMDHQITMVFTATPTVAGVKEVLEQAKLLGADDTARFDMQRIAGDRGGYCHTLAIRWSRDTLAT